MSEQVGIFSTLWNAFFELEHLLLKAKMIFFCIHKCSQGSINLVLTYGEGDFDSEVTCSCQNKKILTEKMREELLHMYTKDEKNKINGRTCIVVHSLMYSMKKISYHE